MSADLSGLGVVGAGRAVRSSDRIADELARAIRSLRLVPGQTIGEAELARRLGVSRTPVREAISRLSEQGLVVVRPQVGTDVALIDLAKVVEAQFVREHLEAGAFVDGCSQADLDLARLRDAVREQRAAQRDKDAERFFAADEAFHAALFEATGHAGAWLVVHRVKFELDRVRRLVPPPMRALVAEHAQILDHLDRRDVGGRDIVVAHSRRVLDYAPGLVERHPGYFSAAT